MTQELIKELLQTIDDFYESILKPGNLPGFSIGCSYRETILITKTFGNRNDVKPVNNHTKFNVASVSKLFTATLIMKAVEKGLCHLDSPIIDFLPEKDTYSKEIRAITILHLLSHLSGLPREIPGDYWRTEQFPQVSGIYRYLKKTTTVYPCSVVAKYSNFGYMILGAIIENVFQKSFREVMLEEIAVPLQMKNTTLALDLQKEENVAYGFEFSKEGKIILDPYCDLTALNPAGGIISNIEDLLRFLNSQLIPSTNSSILKDETILAMHIPRWIRSDFKLGVCIGWWTKSVANERVLFHGGELRGYSSFMAMFPDFEFGLTLLSNSRNNYEPLIWKICRILKKQREKNKRTLFKYTTNTPFLGEFTSPLGDTLLITPTGSGLLMKKNKSIVSKLRFVGGNRFLMTEGFAHGEILEFIFSDSGRCLHFQVSGMVFNKKE